MKPIQPGRVRNVGKDDWRIVDKSARGDWARLRVFDWSVRNPRAHSALLSLCAFLGSRLAEVRDHEHSRNDSEYDDQANSASRENKAITFYGGHEDGPDDLLTPALPNPQAR